MDDDDRGPVAASGVEVSAGTGVTAPQLALRLNELLGADGHPEYSTALNGLQFDHRGPVRAIAAAVDASRRTIQGAADSGANFLIVHHGLFWAGAQRVVGVQYDRLRLLFEHDIAV